MAGMLDAMGYYKLSFTTIAAYRDLVRSDTCIRKIGATPIQLAQGMSEYARVNPAAFWE